MKKKLIFGLAMIGASVAVLGGCGGLGGSTIESETATTINSETVNTEATTADNVKPYIDNFAPAQSYFKNKITFTITAKDNCAVAGLKLYYSTDKEAWQSVTELTCDNAGTSYDFSYEFNAESMNEGVVYFKAIAVDNAGNESSPIIAAHCIDRTAPQQITDLRASDETGYTALIWNALDNDIEYFVISRADEENGIYSDIESKWTAKNYYDMNVEYGKVYSYRIKAVDAAGNIRS